MDKITYKQEILIRKYLSKPIWISRIIIKKILLKSSIRRVSFCKECGIDVRDFNVSDNDWDTVSKLTNGKNVLCYNCYKDYEFLALAKQRRELHE